MMTECPRCGFVQPQDRYCANCGLDIQNYKPVPDTIAQKLGKNTKLHVFMAIAITLVITVFLFKDHEVKLVSLDRDFTKTSVEENTAAPPPSPSEIATATAGSPDDETLAPSASAAEIDATAAAAKKYERIEITFSEMSSSLIQQLSAEGQILTDSGPRRALLVDRIQNIASLKDRDIDFHVLPGFRSGKLLEALNINFHKTNASDNQSSGIALQFNSAFDSSQRIDLTMTGDLDLIGADSAPIAAQELTGSFQFSPSNTLLLIGYLPHQPIREQDLASHSNTPLAIYESPQFINGLTEFVILIQIR